jgi:hypothetical protein
MHRFFFSYDKGRIGKQLGYVENLGLYCPKCNSFVGGKGKCPSCGYYEYKETVSTEATHDVPIITGCFIFKYKFNPVIMAKDLIEFISNKDSQVIDSNGEVYTNDDFKKYIKNSELDDTYSNLHSFIDSSTTERATLSTNREDYYPIESD